MITSLVPDPLPVINIGYFTLVALTFVSANTPKYLAAMIVMMVVHDDQPCYAGSLCRAVGLDCANDGLSLAPRSPSQELYALRPQFSVVSANVKKCCQPMKDGER